MFDLASTIFVWLWGGSLGFVWVLYFCCGFFPCFVWVCLGFTCV